MIGSAAYRDKPRVLLVEDEAVLREHLAEVLSDEYSMETAADGEQALRAVLRNRPDLVVTDLVMPGLDGIELVKALRRTPSTSTIPILMISGHAPQEVQLRGFEFGADAYLAKPYTEKELRVRVRALLQVVQLRNESARAEERQRAEHEALVERAALLESITDAFYAVDRHWRVTYANQRALDYFRRSREHFVGKVIWDEFPVGKESIVERTYRRVMETQRAESFEMLSPLTERWIEAHVYPTPQGLAVNFRDVTDRKAAEDSHRQSEERYQAFLANSSEAIWRYELNPPLDLALSIDEQIRHVYEHGVLAELNDAMARMYGYERAEDLVGAPLAKTLPPDDSAFEYLRSIASTGYSLTDIESVERDRDGHIRHFSNSLIPVIKDGKLLRAWGTQRDITDRKLAEQAIRDNERHKDEFLAILAHELRNPLAPVRTGLQILRRQGFADLTAQRTLSMMDRQMTHLVRLVDDLLDISRINSGRLQLKREKVLVADALEAAAESVREAIETNRHQLIIDNCAERLCVYADPSRLAQIFSNLLSNAAKYSDSGGRISVTMERQNDEGVITVRDTGIGIPNTELDRVFDMFSQVRTHQARAGGGLGIGLALVRTLVEMHGGNVSAVSEGAGNGSSFTVRLPLVDSADAARSTGPVHRVAAPNINSRRILVVDDNADAATSLAVLLEGEGAQVKTAADGEEAIQVTHDFQPHAIFMDLGMPKLDGIKATRRIRALPVGKDILIVALTGWGQPADRQRTHAAGFDQHLVKPVSAEELLSTLRSLEAGAQA